jgi:hypothetical protein
VTECVIRRCDVVGGVLGQVVVGEKVKQYILIDVFWEAGVSLKSHLELKITH